MENIESKNSKHIFYFNIQRHQLEDNNKNDAKRNWIDKTIYICGMEKDANSAYLDSMSATKKGMRTSSNVENLIVAHPVQLHFSLFRTLFKSLVGGGDESILVFSSLNFSQIGLSIFLLLNIAHSKMYSKSNV